MTRGWRNDEQGRWVSLRPVLSGLLVAGVVAACGALADEIPSEPPAEIPAGSRLSDKPIPMATELQRPKPLVEIGDHFLDTGKLQRGFQLPGGAIWQPSLLIFGNYRTAIQTFNDVAPRVTEWANRLDVFANLQLTGTERAIIGFRPIDNQREYAGFQFEPDRGFKSVADGNVQVAFFEGNLREMIPDLDPKDTHALDYAFAVGRQPLLLQDGILLNDTIDAVGVVRNAVHTPWTSGLRLDAIYGWGHINRNDNLPDNSAQLFALNAAADLYWTTMELDAIYVSADKKTGDGVYGGLSGIQRVQLFGESISTSFSIDGSYALDHQTPAVSDGVLFYGEMGRSPKGTPDWMYVDAFWGIDKFSSAAREEDAGGPLGRTGILFEALQLGHYGAPLGNRANDAFGGSVGYQMFWDLFRRQLILELGGRHDNSSSGFDAFGVGGRLQQAFGRHLILGADAFVAAIANHAPGYGARSEAQIKF